MTADPRTLQFWDEELRRMSDDLLPAALKIFFMGGLGGETLLKPNAAALISWDVFNQDAIDWLRKWQHTILRGVNDTTRRQVVGLITDWVQSGEALPSLIKQVASLPTFSQRRAEQIAVTEVTRMYSEGNMAAWRATGGVVGGKRWNTANDEKVCPICAPLHGMVVGLNENGFTTEAGGMGITAPPAHVGCILPGNDVVIPGNVLAATDGIYNGLCVEISLASGGRITVTGNHPILTTDGWVAAQFIRQRDYVFSSQKADRIAASINPHNNNRPAKIEEIFASLKMSPKMFSGRMPATAVDFHGDGGGFHGDVNIVYSHRFLESCREVVAASVSDHSGELVFGLDSVYQGALACKSMQSFFFLGFDTPRGGNMGVNSLAPSIFGSHERPLERFGSGLIPGGNSSVNYSLSESPAIDASLAGEFVLAFSGYVAPEKVVQVRNFDYSGHVYDLQVDPYELYITNGIITHNCRCWLTPVVSEQGFREGLRNALGPRPNG